MARLFFLDYLAIPFALRMPFFSIHGRIGTNAFVDGESVSIHAVTGSFAKLPIGQLSDVKLNVKLSSIGLFEVSGD